jgi:predicted nucleic acid-binding protein
VGTIALDASVVIAFLDALDAQHESAVEVLRHHLVSGHRLLLPASAYAEVLIKPIQQGTASVVDGFVSDSRMEIVAFDRAIALRAAKLRAEHRFLRLPDAMVLATAFECDASLLTLDARLKRAAGGVS